MDFSDSVRSFFLFHCTFIYIYLVFVCFPSAYLFLYQSHTVPLILRPFRCADGRVSSIACGANHSVVTTTDGSAWEFGSRTFITPTPIYSAWEHAPEPDSKDSLKEKEKKHVIRAVQAVAGESVSGFIDADGKLYTWGAQRHSAALGRKAEFLGVKQFEKVEALDGKIVFSAQLGSQHGLAAVQEVQK